MTKEEIQSEIRRAVDMTDRLLLVRPNDEDLLGAKKGLERVSEIVSRNWPLPPEDRKQINMGLYAVRALDGGPYGELPNALMTLDAHLKNG
jgi:hypothetical protein